MSGGGVVEKTQLSQPKLGRAASAVRRRKEAWALPSRHPMMSPETHAAAAYIGAATTKINEINRRTTCRTKSNWREVPRLL